MWDAKLYDSFEKERIQPSLDLTYRISADRVNKILDVGCGSGMSTRALKTRWQNSEIIGADLSREMLAKAQEILPEVKFVCRDCSLPFGDLGKFDIVFSNAFMQWIPNQKQFVANSFEVLNEDGIFAAQIPLFNEMPANDCIINAYKEVAGNCSGDNGIFTIYSAQEYYDLFSHYYSDIDIWVTDYYHVMQSQAEILEFLTGTALRPYMQNLKKEQTEHFLKAVHDKLCEVYPTQKDGKVLFAFKRLFIIAKK